MMATPDQAQRSTLDIPHRTCMIVPSQARHHFRLQALHVLAWLGSSNEVYKPPGKKADALQDARCLLHSTMSMPLISWQADTCVAVHPRLVEARRGYQARLSAMLSQGHGGLTRLQAALVQAASLFEELQAQGGLAPEVRGKRLAAAIILYDHALAAVPLEVSRSRDLGLHSAYLPLLYCCC